MLPEIPKTVAETIKHFTGRTWLLLPVLNWLEQTDERLFLITGAPGSGKSHIVAWFAGAGPVCSDPEPRAQLSQIRSRVGGAHFCIANSSSIDPRQLAINLAEQLAQKIQGFGQILAATLPNQVQITFRGDAGSTTANELFAFLRNLNLTRMSGRASFDLLVREPLKQLYAQGYDQLILLLIDSIDDAETYSGDSKIGRLLTSLDDLPRQVRVLATSLPDPSLLQKYFAGIKQFDLIADAPVGNGDVRLYAFSHLAGLPHQQRKRFAKQIDEAAGGNLLYAALVLKDLASRVTSLREVEKLSLPAGLPGVYQEFLHREVGLDKDRWTNLFQPLLGAAAVAYGNGFYRADLERIVGQDVQQALQICGDFLTGELPDGPFRLRHQSLADFLFDATVNTQYALDAPQIHRRIVVMYRQKYRGRWSSVDSYALSHLVKHLLAADVEKKLGRLHENKYAPRHLFYHMKAAGRADEIEQLINRVCGP